MKENSVSKLRKVVTISERKSFSDYLRIIGFSDSDVGRISTCLLLHNNQGNLKKIIKTACLITY